MRQHFLSTVLLFSILLLLMPAEGLSAAQNKIWRVAYVEAGPFTDYQQVLRGLALGLQRQGLIENGDVPIPLQCGTGSNAMRGGRASSF